MTTPFAYFVLIMGFIFIGLLYWFKLRMMKKRLGLSILGLIISAYPTITFFSFLHFLMQFYFQRKGNVQFEVDPENDMIGFIGGWTGVSVPLSTFIISATFTPIFFICLALLLKEWKVRRDNQRKIRESLEEDVTRNKPCIDSL